MSRRLLGAVLLLVAGVVAVVGTFLPLYDERGGAGDDRRPLVAVTSWEYVFTNLPEGVDFGRLQSPQYGVPIVVAAVLLAVAVALVFLPESQRLAARYLAVGGTGLLAGSVWSAWTAVMAAVGNSAQEPDDGGFTVRVGEGSLAMAASVVVAVVGVVLLHARRPQPRPEGPVVYRVDGVEDDDTDTPPFGIPVVEVEVARLPDPQYDPHPEVARLPDSDYDPGPEVARLPDPDYDRRAEGVRPPDSERRADGT